jgi:hypothetical protein
MTHLEPGQAVALGLDPARILLFDRESGLLLD